MFGSVPRLSWRSAVFALAAVACLLAAAPALAADRPRPTATPLWEAYPLVGKAQAKAQRAAAKRDAAKADATAPATPSQTSDSLLRTNVSAIPVTPLRQPQRKVDPAVVVLFYIAIVTFIVTLALLVRRQVRRSRAPRTARG
jgi:hypothetical protein